MRLMILMAGLMIGLSCASVSADGPKSVSAKDFGAKGDGVTDDTVAIQKALDSVNGGGIVNLPAGRYMLSAALSVPGGVTLLGEGVRWENGATGLIIPKTGYSAVKLSHGSSVKGLVISYPNNQDVEKPEAYPPSVLVQGINPSVENIVFDCAWIGVSSTPGGANAGQGMFRDLTGFIHHVGIHLSGGLDVNRILDVHWFVGGKGDHSKSYYRKNRVGFEFGRVDGLIMERCFIIGGKTFLHHLKYRDTPDDAKKELNHSLGFAISNCWIEDVDNGFVFEGMVGFTLSNTNILVRGGGVGVSVIPDSLYYNASIDNVQVRGFGKPFTGFDYDTKVPHGRNRLSISDCQVIDGAPALRLGPGAIRANIHDNHFQGNPAIKIEKGANLLVITNNVLSSKTPLVDESGDVTKNISGNIEEK